LNKFNPVAHVSGNIGSTCKIMCRHKISAKAGNHLINWIPVFTGSPGFRLEFTPLQNGAGMTKTGPK